METRKESRERLQRERMQREKNALDESSMDRTKAVADIIISGPRAVVEAAVQELELIKNIDVQDVAYREPEDQSEVPNM